MPAEPLVEQTLAEHIASLRQRKYEVPVIRDPDDVTEETGASTGKKREEIRPIIRRPSRFSLSQGTTYFMKVTQLIISMLC